MIRLYFRNPAGGIIIKDINYPDAAPNSVKQEDGSEIIKIRSLLGWPVELMKAYANCTQFQDGSLNGAGVIADFLGDYNQAALQLRIANFVEDNPPIEGEKYEIIFLDD